MAPRATFKGFLRLSLISVPVKAFTATASGAEIRLNQLHADCHNRIRYQKTCPVHGEVKNDEIVSGYEHAKDQYVVIDPDELQAFRKKSDKSIEIDGFISADELEPVYFSGRTYYLLPDGPVGQKPYQLLRQAMEKDQLFAVCRAILSGREQLCVLRPVDNLLGLSILNYASKVKGSSSFEDELVEASFSQDELNLTQTLIDASVLEDFDIAAYKDDYVNQVTGLIEAKIEGEEIVAAPDPEEPKVINLMEALKASVANLDTGGAKTGTSRSSSSSSSSRKKTTTRKSTTKKTASKAKVKSKMAPSTAERTTKRKRKSG